jgi:hypothetical protein
MLTTVIIRLIAAALITGAMATDSQAQSLAVDWKLPDELVLRAKAGSGVGRRLRGARSARR